MTTPGGVPNLPVGALTLDTLVSRLEDMSPEAMRARAGERWPSIFGYSTGGDIMSDLSLSGIIAKLFSGFNSVVANADPADIDGPEDLPGLLWDFITSLPVVGELVGLLEAIIGEYDGDDEVLLAIQEIFMPLRRLVQLVAGKDVDWPTAGEVAEGWEDLGDALASAAKNAISEIRGLIDISWLTDEHQNLILESGYDAPITVVAEDDPAITQDPTDGIPGTTPLGCLRIELDGQNHERIGELIPVGKGWELSVSSGVRRESVTAAAGALRVELQPYMLAGDVATPVGARVVVASVASPAGSSAGWETISGTWTVPSDGSVNRVAVIPRATSAATAGVVKFDNTTMVATQAIPQNFIKDLLADLESLMNWIGTVVDTLLTRLGLPPTGSLLDRIHDLGDEIQLMQERGEDALEGLADKLGLTDWENHLSTLLSDPGSLLGQLGAGKITGLLNWQQTMDQIAELQGGNLGLTAINSVVQAVKDNLTSLGGKVQHLTSGGQLSASNLTNQDALDIVAAVRDGAGDIANTFTDGVKDAYDNLRDLFGFMVEARDIALTAQQQLQNITNDTEAPPELNGMSWSTTFGGTLDSALPGGDWSGSSELVIKESGHVGLAGSAAFNNHYWKVTAQAFLTSGQSASIVLSPGKGKDGHLYRTGVYVNCNSTFTSAAYAHITSGSISFGRMTRSGSVFTFNQLTFVSGAFKVGDLARLRYHGGTYHVVVNGLTKLQFTDSGNVIPTGAGYDRAGFSEQKSQEFSDWFSSWHYESWRVAGFAMSDWLPIGVNVTTASWRLRRGAGGEVALSVGHGAQAAMPNGFYGVQDLSSGVTVTDLGSGQVTITEAGWYEISATSINRDNFSETAGTDAGIKNAGDNTESWRASPWVLFVDGVAIAGPIMAGVSTTVYLGAGQTVRPGVSAASPLGGAGSFAASGGPNLIDWRSQGYRGRSAISHVSGAPSASFTGRKVAT